MKPKSGKQRIAELYPDMLQWAKRKMGDNGQDYLHDAVVGLLKTPRITSRLTDLELTGRWRKLTSSLRDLEKRVVSNRGTVLNTDMDTIADNSKAVKKYTKELVRTLPLAENRVMRSLYIYGDTYTDCAKLFDTKISTIQRVERRALRTLGNLVKTERELL